MFLLTLVLLLYAKHFNRSTANNRSYNQNQASTSEQCDSGVDRAVVNSLPIFKFSSLSGPHKDGLECAVCLNSFVPSELMRLLPRCKHGFHVECVDIWLEAHSTCPLCRVRVNPEDVLLVLDNEYNDNVVVDIPEAEEKEKNNVVSLPLVRRKSGRHSSAGERCSNREVKIALNRRVSEGGDNNTAVSLGCLEKSRKDGLLLTESTSFVQREEFERRYSHRIVVDGGEGNQERWSDCKPSDLLHLRPEAIIAGSGRARNNMRSVSEITGLSRFKEVVKSKRTSWWHGNGTRS